MKPVIVAVVAVLLAVAAIGWPLSAKDPENRARRFLFGDNILNQAAIARHVASKAAGASGVAGTEPMVMCAVAPSATARLVAALEAQGVPDLAWDERIGYLRGRLTSTMLASLDDRAIESCQLDDIAEFKRLHREALTSTAEPTLSAVTGDAPPPAPPGGDRPAPRGRHDSVRHQLHLGRVRGSVRSDGRGVTIAIVESTGIQITHPLLSGALTLEGHPSRKIARLIVPAAATNALSIALPAGPTAPTTATIWGRPYLMQVDWRERTLGIDLNRNGSLQDDPALYDYNSPRWTAASIGIAPREGRPVRFVVTLDEERRLVHVHAFTVEHALLVASMAAGGDPSGHVDGVAPAASLVMVAAGLTTVSRFEGILAAARDTGVDIVSCSFMLDPGPGNGQPATTATLIDRIILTYGKPVFFAATNVGGGFLSRRGIGRYAIVVGAYGTRHAARRLLGISAPAERFVSTYTPWGSAEGDGLFPDVLAPSIAPAASPCAAVSARGRDRHGRTLDGSCVTLSRGTSSATPAAAGLAAVILSVARQKGISLSGSGLRRLLLTTASKIAAAPAILQGHGVVNPSGAMASLLADGAADAAVGMTLDLVPKAEDGDVGRASTLLSIPPGEVRSARLHVSGNRRTDLEIAGDAGLVRLIDPESAGDGALLEIAPPGAGVFAAHVYAVDARTRRRLAWLPIEIIGKPAAVGRETGAAVRLQPMQRWDHLVMAPAESILRYCLDVQSGTVMRSLSVDAGYSLENVGPTVPPTWAAVEGGRAFCEAHAMPSAQAALVSLAADATLSPLRATTRASLQLSALAGTLDVSTSKGRGGQSHDVQTITAHVRSRISTLEAPEVSIWRSQRTALYPRGAATDVWTPGIIEPRSGDAALLFRVGRRASDARLFLFVCSPSSCELAADPLSGSPEALVSVEAVKGRTVVPVIVSRDADVAMKVEYLSLSAAPLVREAGPRVPVGATWETSFSLPSFQRAPDEGLLVILSDRTLQTGSARRIPSTDETLARVILN